VDGHTQRETTSAAISQPGSGQATIWFIRAVWPPPAPASVPADTCGW
jgi:hypothetical protein